MGQFTMRVQGADKRSDSATAVGAPEASHVASTVPCRFFTAVMHNGSASDRWFQVFDAAATPTDGEIPILTQKVTTGNTASYDLTDGIPFKNGVVVATSSTDQLLTLAAAEALFCVTVRKH